MLLQGVFVPLTCPFYRDGASYVRKLEHNVARYSLSPVSGLIALAPGTEAASLTDAEAHQTLRAVSEVAGKEKVLLAGIERTSISAALELIQIAEKALFDAVVLAPPPGWARLVHGSDARELITFYEVIADRSPLPILLWSDAAPPFLELPVEVVATLARHRNVLGILDAGLTAERLQVLRSETEAVRHEVTVTIVFEAVTRRMQQPSHETAGSTAFVAVEALSGNGSATATAALPATLMPPVLKTRTKAVGFQILSAGAAHDVVSLLEAGTAGIAPQVAACVPQACFEAYAAWKDADLSLARERAQRLAQIEALVDRLGPAAVKAGCDYNGYFGGQPRLPRLPLVAQDRDAVEQALASTRN